MTEPARGEVWLVDFEPAEGSEPNKIRPAIVISSDTFHYLPIRVVVPLTEWRDKFEHHRNKVQVPRSDGNGLYVDSAADLMLLRSVALTRFSEQLGEVSPSELEELLLTAGLVFEWS